MAGLEPMRSPAIKSSVDGPVFDEVVRILGETLQLGHRAPALKVDTRLVGSLPEFDSMAVVGVIVALEERFGFIVDDDEISAETFATVGSLVAFVEGKVDT